MAPGLSLTGVRLIIADHAAGLPVLRALTLCTCCHHYPGAATGNTLRSFPQPYQPSPEWPPGRPAQCPFRGLLSVHSHYGLHTRGIAYSDPLHRRLQPLRYLHDCSDCFRPERFSRVGLSPTDNAPPWQGARHTGHLGCLRNFRFLRSVNDGFSASNLESSSARPGHYLPVETTFQFQQIKAFETHLNVRI